MCFLFVQGVLPRRNVCESCRFKKNHIQIRVPTHPRTYERNFINLLKTPIPDISTSTSTIIFSVKTLIKIVSIYVMASTADFPVSKNR